MVQEESRLRLHVMGLLGLSGWKMLQPGGMRLPVPEEFIYDLGFLALQQQRVATWLSPSPSSMYLRRSEMLGLTLDHVGYPASGRYNKRSLVTDRRWLSDAMALYVGKCKHELFPNITLRFYERWCERSCKQLGYRSACIMPHILRHYGASNDMVHKRRSLHEIQRRGRWQARKVSPAMRSMLCCSNGGSKLRRNEWPRFDDNLRALAQPFCAF